MTNDYFAKQISLRPGEKIVTVLHHHPISSLKQIIITAFLILLAFFLMFFLFSMGAFGVALFLAILLTGIFYGAREFYLWFANVFIVTSQRIIDLDQTGFFNKTVSEADYNKILDICYSVKGVGQTIFKLGTIKINAAGVKLVINNVPRVMKVNQLLSDLIREDTGKDIEPKKVREVVEQRKYQLKDKEKNMADFLNQDNLEEYDEYDLQDLVDEYVEVFSELRLKKYLVDELEDYDAKHPEELSEEDDETDESDQEDVNEDNIDDEIKGGKETKGKIKFKKKKL